MDLQLKDKRALVTGSNTGIGKGIAAVLAREGATVVIHGRNSERAEMAAKDIKNSGGRAIVVLGDLATDAGAKKVADAVIAGLGGIDILVNNAGGNETANFGNPEWFDVPVEHWGAVTQQNVVSSVRLIKALVPGMRERHWGRVINISSLGGFQPTAQVPNYCAAKAAVLNLTVSLAKALARTGITVNTVSPGLVRTPMLEAWLAGLGKQLGWEGNFEALEARFVTELMPLAVSQVARVEEIGDVVAFLASPLSRFITGANVHVDGGQSQTLY
jgi:NAD(P)-dependent dehydrogenase (short-subunit alcohol dehydrogenase family)